MWIIESYSVRQLSVISGFSKTKLKRIIQHWLKQEPKELTDLSQCKYLFYDGTYFHKNGCLICLMDMQSQRIISNIYTDKEGFKSASPWFETLKQRGLDPDGIIMDGERSVLRAFRAIWPKMIIQRCLYHIQREGLRWLRSHPKTNAGIELRRLLSTLCAVKSIKERDQFICGFEQWLKSYIDLIKTLPNDNIAFKDLKRTITLIKNALPDMFRYLDTPMSATTNTIESFYSRLKADYQRHRGMSAINKIRYLKWYCHYKNSNTL